MIGGCYREGREDQFGALGLVLNALILWKTRYMDAAPTHLRSEGVEVKDEDVARLSPLGDKHINVQGRYHFTITDAVKRVSFGRCAIRTKWSNFSGAKSFSVRFGFNDPESGGWHRDKRPKKLKRPAIATVAHFTLSETTYFVAIACSQMAMAELQLPLSG